jgi:FMN reductase
MSQVVILTGSPAAPSRTAGLAEFISKKLRDLGLSVSLVSVRDLPPEDLIFGRYDSSSLVEPIGLLKAADAVIVATPVYKASYTGVLKAFLDLLPPLIFANKPVLAIATGATIAHLLSLRYTLEPLLAELGATQILRSVYAVDQQIQWLDQNRTQVSLEPELEERLQASLTDFLGVIAPHQASLLTPT